jgi:hypothetical protein
MQSPADSFTRLIGWGAAACWLISWFLPVVDGYPGWAAFYTALTGPFRSDYPVRGDDSVPQVLSALTNLAFGVLLTQWARDQVSRPSMFLKIAIACLLCNLYWLVSALRAGEPRALLTGYYLWLAAFALLVLLGIIRAVSDRRTSRTPTGGTPA